MPQSREVAYVVSQVRGALEGCGLDVARGPLVVAVSGGPDSVALLYALHTVGDDLGLRLHVAHLDHGLRGEAGAEDSRFVQSLAAGLGLPVTAERADVPAYRRRRRLSVETAAREVRYAFLTRLVRELGAVAVAQGHTADDQAETVLLHLLRGTGLAGLRGMEILSSSGGVVLLRPLLEVWRTETEAFCTALGLEVRRDASNLSPQFTRNRIRRQLLPRMAAFNPGVKKALVRLARAAAEDLRFLDQEVCRRWEQVVSAPGRQDEGLLLRRGSLAQLHPALRAHLLRRAYATLRGGYPEGLEQVHIEEGLALLEGAAGRRLSLPGGQVLSIGYDEAYLGPPGSEPCPLPPLEGEHVISVPGEREFSGWRVVASILPYEGHTLSAGRTCTFHSERLAEGPTLSLSKGGPWETDDYRALLDADAVGPELHLRARRPGERFQPLGMEKDKKLQDFFTDARVPQLWRGRVPLVVSGSGIAWVVGWRIAHWARVTPQTRWVLALEFSPSG